MRRITLALFFLAVGLAGVPPVAAGGASLWPGPGPRPGPPVLYWGRAAAPQLTNTGIWRASPLLVSGASAYRAGEFLYQDFLYDDHGAREMADPGDPRAFGDTFSRPNGTYTYPTGAGYDNNAADLVEVRVKPLARATAFRVTLNTLANPSLIAFTFAIGGRPAAEHLFPAGANVRAPAALFLTVHPGRSGLVADLVTAGRLRRVSGPAPRVAVDLVRRQIEVTVPHREWNPSRHVVRLALGVGLWDRTHGRYLLPQAVAGTTTPGGAGTAAHPAAFFNVAFRSHEPRPSIAAGTSVLTNPAWWRDRQQGWSLAAGDISSLYANVDFAKLARGATDDSAIPTTGPIDRVVASHFEPGQGVSYSSQCGLGGGFRPSSCTPELQDRLQPYAIDIPATPAPTGGYGLTLLLHSLSANYNQYTGSRNQAQFAIRSTPSIVITPEARGPDQFYQGLGAADMFEVWADVARRYQLNPVLTDISGYSMGGLGTLDLGSQFPDLFARAQPTVGFEYNTDVLASLRNVPVLMWNNSGDELATAPAYGGTASKLQYLGYRYELDAFEPCLTTPSPARCSPLFPNHLELAVNDQYAPAAAFLDSAQVERDPAHITYVLDAARDRPSLGIVADHAYWVSGLKIRGRSHRSYMGDVEGQIDAVSRGFGRGDPVAQIPQAGLATLPGGNLGTLRYAATKVAWGRPPPAPALDLLDIIATNLSAATIDVARAHVDCHAIVNVTTDGPIAVTLAGCNRVVRAG